MGSINRRKWGAALALAMASGIVVNGLRLRWRLRALPVLPEVAVPGDRLRRSAAGAGAGPAGAPVVVHVEAGAVDEATVRAAVAHMRAYGLACVDLVPGDLRVEDLLDLLRLSDRHRLRTDPIFPAFGAGQAVVVDRALAERAGITGGPADPVDVRRAFAQAKLFAPRGVDQVVAPGLRAIPQRVEQNLSVWRHEMGRPLPIHLAARCVPPLVAGAVAASPAGPVGALAVAAAAAVQPTLVTAGLAPRPADRRRPGATATRLAAAPLRVARSLRGGWRPARPAHTEPAFIAEARVAYEADLAQGVERFLGPERPDCPICASPDIRPRLCTPDMIQAKPGRFRVDTCRACGHNFQNPQLTPEGLDFYYRDFYDGAGTADTQMMFSADLRPYRRRAAAVGAVATPRRWLDVGGGHGHFCLAAAGVHPSTTFELLDQSDAVDEAVARGWVDRGHHGMFPKLAPELDERFDVVSMFHYLEHTVDPLAELDAAHRVLEPGGVLMIEVPAPDSRPARWLGWAWGPWMQPQHLNLMPMAALVDQLEARGFEILDTERRLPFQPFDATWAAFQVLTRVVPGPDAPWTPPRTTAHRLGRAVGLGAGGLLIVAGALVDRLVVTPLLRVDPRMSGAYWVVARKQAAAPAG
jgi:SAM-dependent methyltransferase